MGLFFWILESTVHVLLFSRTSKTSILQQIFVPDLHDSWMRILVFVLFTVFGIIMQVQINKRRKIEEALKNSEREKSMILNTASAFMAYIDNDDNILWANKVAAEYSEGRPDSIIGKKCYRVWQERTEPCPDCLVRKSRVTGKIEEGEITLANGKILNIRASAVKNEKGEVIGAVEIASDITERKKAEEKVKELNEVLRLLNKTLRHDILNDLTIISNSIEIYKEIKDREILNHAFNSIKKSVKLINEMRELESLVFTGKNIRPYNVREVIESVLKNYLVEYHIEGDSTVLADEALSSVFDNIVRNAIDHGKADRIEVNIINKNEFCEIRIADNGTGIPDNIKDMIFEEGFSADNGSGLGLYIVSKTVERYEGSVRVEDNNPNGTVFIITLNYPETKEKVLKTGVN